MKQLLEDTVRFTTWFVKISCTFWVSCNLAKIDEKGKEHLIKKFNTYIIKHCIHANESLYNCWNNFTHEEKQSTLKNLTTKALTDVTLEIDKSYFFIILTNCLACKGEEKARKLFPSFIFITHCQYCLFFLIENNDFHKSS